LGALPTKFKVMPLNAPVTVLVALLKGTPSMVSEAFWPSTDLWKFNPVVFPVIVRSPGCPIVWLMSARRDPFSSLITLAATPSCSLLIVLARPLRVLLLLSTVMSVLFVPTWSVMTPV
jgi:hypothetical protein